MTQTADFSHARVKAGVLRARLPAGRAAAALCWLAGACVLTGCVAPPLEGGYTHDSYSTGGYYDTNTVVYTRYGSPPPMRREYRSAAPQPDYIWLGGDWVWGGSRYDWRPGRWAPPHTRHIAPPPAPVRPGWGPAPGGRASEREWRDMRGLREQQGGRDARPQMPQQRPGAQAIERPGRAQGMPDRPPQPQGRPGQERPNRDEGRGPRSQAGPSDPQGAPPTPRARPERGQAPAAGAPREREREDRPARPDERRQGGERGRD